MILHDITIGGFRTFADELHVGPFDERITVIHAPNGTGKTTLLEGFYHALLQTHQVSGIRAESTLRSLGRDLTPRAAVTFTTGQVRYRLEKRFLDHASARLLREEDGAFKAFREDEAATQFVRDLLLAKTPGRGPIKADEHFGLGALLWAPQGRIALPALTSEVLAQARTRLAGAAVTFGEHDAQLARFVAQWHERFYTPKGQEATNATSVNLPALRKAAREADERFAVAGALVERLDALRTRCDEFAAERTRFGNLVKLIEVDLVERTIGVERYHTASLAKAHAETEHSFAHERWTHADEAVRLVESSRRALERAEKTAEERRSERDDVSERCAAAALQLAQARTAGDVVAARFEAAEDCAAVAGDAASFAQALRDVVTAKERLAGDEARRAEVVALRSERAALFAPTIKEMRAIRKRASDLATTRARLDAAILHVTFSATTPHVVTITHGSAAAGLRTGHSRAVVIDGSPIVEFSIDGVGTVRATGASASADAIRAELAEVGRDLARLVLPFETADIVELERRLEAAASLDATVGKVEAVIADRRADASSTEDLKAQIVASERTLCELARRHAGWSEAVPPDAAALANAAAVELDQARAERKTATAAIKVAETEAAARAIALQRAELNLATAGAIIAQYRGQLQVRESDGLDDAARAAKRSGCGLALIAASGALASALEMLSGFPVDPRVEYAVLETKLSGTREASLEAEREHAATAALLDAEMARGLYETLATAEADMHACRRRLRSATDEAAAAKLLADTFRTVEAERQTAILDPLRRRAAELYATVAGSAPADLHFGPELGFTGIEVAGKLLSQTLSGGETEQLQMVTRLALADLVTDGERQLVVLDDSLGVTDPRRFARFLAIVSDFAQTRMQFVIATCDKSRYLGLAGATFLDLDALRRHGRETKSSGRSISGEAYANSGS